MTRVAVQRGELAAGTAPDQVAFELNALAVGANQARQLHGAGDAGERTLRAMQRALGVDPAAS